MSRPRNPKPLVEKIAEAFAKVDRLERAGTNKARRYKYTRASDVLAAVRLELLRRGVLMCPTEAPAEYVERGETNGGEYLTECRLQVTYTFRDALEKLEPMVVNGIGRDVDDKALYKAQTGAQKALLKRFGLLAETIDDPEFEDYGDEAGAGETLDDVAPLKGSKPAKTVTPLQIRAFQEACEEHGKTPEEQTAYLEREHQVRTIAELGRGRPFTAAIKWASNGEGTLAPKPQAVPEQTKLQLRTAPQIDLKIGNKTVSWEPTQKASYSQ